MPVVLCANEAPSPDDAWSFLVEASNIRKTQPLAVLVCPGIARLTVISGVAPVGKSFVLSGELLSIGGAEEDADFSMDPSVRATHASLVNSDGNYVIRDEGADNGVYVRVRSRQKLALPAKVRVGAQQLHVVAAKDDQPYVWQDGTRLLTSPPRLGTFAVHQILEGGLVGAAALVSDNDVTIGCSGARLDLSHDPAISSSHARIFAEDGAVWLEDLGSTNGTYVRVQGEVALQHGDLLWVGQQLLRFDLT